MPTSPGLDKLVNLVASVHATEVKQLDSWSSIRKFGGIIRRRSKLLQNLSANASSWLFPLNHGAVAKIALDKEHHFVVLHQDLVATDVV